MEVWFLHAWDLTLKLCQTFHPYLYSEAIWLTRISHLLLCVPVNDRLGAVVGVCLLFMSNLKNVILSLH